MSDLTQYQQDMLNALRYSHGYTSARYLLTKLADNHRTEQGVHQTAASLVRKGYLLKRREWAHGNRTVGPIAYSVSPKGVEWLQATDSLTAQAAR